MGDRYIPEVTVAHALRGLERDLLSRVATSDESARVVRSIVDDWRRILDIGRETEAKGLLNRIRPEKGGEE